MADQPSKNIHIAGIYQSASSSNVRIPALLNSDQLEINNNLSVSSTPFVLQGNNAVGVSVTAAVKASQKSNSAEAFTLNITLTALCQLDGFTQEEANSVINVDVPNLLLPYINEALILASVKTGYPAIVLPPMSFRSSPDPEPTKH